MFKPELIGPLGINEDDEERPQQKSAELGMGLGDHIWRSRGRHENPKLIYLFLWMEWPVSGKCLSRRKQGLGKRR